MKPILERIQALENAVEELKSATNPPWKPQAWYITANEFINFVSTTEGPPVDSDEDSRTRAYKAAALCIATEAYRTFGPKDWADVWYNPESFGPINHDQALQNWLDEKSVEYSCNNKSRNDFLVYVANVITGRAFLLHPVYKTRYQEESE